MEINDKFYDDGNWNWHYECKYSIPTNNLKDWYYNISFETPKGGYLNNEEINVYYWNAKNLLQIGHSGERIDFFVENFHDIKNILNPMIKANNAIVYPIYKSNITERKNKIININTLNI